MPRSVDAGRWAALALALPVLASCSEYLARQDGISVYAGNAKHANAVVHMVDPWPRVAADRDLPHDGAVIGRAVQRYRAGRVIPPRLGGTSSVYQEQGQAAQSPADPAPQGGAAQASATPK